jgi:hypothetical protein
MLSFFQLRTLLSKFVAVAIIVTFMYIVSTENLFQTFVARAYCMEGESKLIAMHFLSDSLISTNFFIIAYLFYSLYNSFKNKHVPFKGFLWLFSIGGLLAGLTHLMGVLNLFVTFYWLDAVIKFACGWFGLGIAVTFMRTVNEIKEFKSPEEYNHLRRELEELKTRLKLEEGDK